MVGLHFQSRQGSKGVILEVLWQDLNGRIGGMMELPDCMCSYFRIKDGFWCWGIELYGRHLDMLVI